MLGEEEEGWWGAQGEMEKCTRERRRGEAEEGNKGPRKAPDRGLGTQSCGQVLGERGAGGNPPAEPGSASETG